MVRAISRSLESKHGPLAAAESEAGDRQDSLLLLLDAFLRDTEPKLDDLRVRFGELEDKLRNLAIWLAEVCVTYAISPLMVAPMCS